MSDAPKSEQAESESAAPTSKSTTIFIVVVVVVIAAAWWIISNSGKQSTDDAYVHGHKHMVAARIAGHVQEVLVEDNQMVKKGDPLVRLDTERYQRLHEAAKAKLAEAKAARDAAAENLAVLKVTTVDDLKSAEAALAFLGFRREMAQQALTEDPGSVSQFYLKEREKEVVQAEAQLNSAKTGPRQVAQATADFNRAEAAVAAAEAALKQSELSLKYCEVVAPADGQVVKKTVEVGHQIGAGTPLLAVVELKTTWILANFKETQLTRVRPGQKAEITVDTYGNTLSGVIDSIDGGTGAAFGLFPPQNATGNFVKITQRIPVKIVIKEDQRDKDLPLRIGMSCNVTVFLNDSEGDSTE